MDPDQSFSDEFLQPPNVLYKYIPARRLDDALPHRKPCSFRATPPNELNDLNEINFKAVFVDDESNREEVNRQYALALSEIFPTSPVSVDAVESYRQNNPIGYGAELACDQLSKRYGVTSFSTSRDDATMWSHYADNCRGIVIGYNIDLWVRHLIGVSIFRHVRYTDDLPPIIGPGVVNQENVYGFMSSKGATWAYEKEWRLITELSKTKRSATGIAVLSVPQESVSSILITDRTPGEAVDIVVRRLNDPYNGYHVLRIDKMRRGLGGSKLPFAGQIDTRTYSAIR